MKPEVLIFRPTKEKKFFLVVPRGCGEDLYFWDGRDSFIKDESRGIFFRTMQEARERQKELAKRSFFIFIEEHEGELK